MRGWQANKKTHLCVASSIRAMPEAEIPPAKRVDTYYTEKSMKKDSRGKTDVKHICSSKENLFC